MHRRRHWALATLAAGLLLAAGQAEATTLTSTNYSAWKAGLIGQPTELDFSAIQFQSYSNSTGITLKAVGNSSIGFAFTGPDNPPTYKLTGVSYNSFTSLEGGTDAAASINVTTPVSGDNALLLGLATTKGTPITLTLSDGEVFSITTALFGVSISHPITWLTLSTASSSAVIVDDFWFGASDLPQDSAVSEGTTMAMCGGGLLVVFGSIGRKNRRRRT